MKHLPIELEIRGEIMKDDIPILIERIKKAGFKFVNETRRTSVMSFGNVSPFEKKDKKITTQVDVRCRITNGKSEIVTKIGLTHANNRTEISQSVSLKELLTFARMFGSMGFFTKVGSKRTQNFKRGPISISFVVSPSGLAYIEIEKMTDREHEKKDLKELELIARELGIRIWKSRKQFLDFCDQLTKRDDWEFRGLTKDIERLKKEIKITKSDRP